MSKYQNKTNKALLLLLPTLLMVCLLMGCVSVKIPEDLPDNAQVRIEVHVAGYKSAAGRGNLLEVKTDAEIPLFRHSADAVKDETTYATEQKQ